MHGRAGGVSYSTPSILVLQKIYALLNQTPFQPFAVLTGDDYEYLVPTPGHAAVNPQRTRVVIFTDQDEEFSLSALRIVNIRGPLEFAR